MTSADPAPPPFRCRRCGACCRWPGIVRLDEADIARLAAHLGLPEERFLADCTRLAPDRRSLSLTERPGGVCIFLDDATSSCRVYPARPRQCRDFPSRWRDPDCPAL